MTAASDNARVGGQRGWIFRERFLQPLVDVGQFVCFVMQRGEPGRRTVCQEPAKQRDTRERMAQGGEVARRSHAQRCAAGEPFEILYAAQVLANLLAQHGVGFQLRHGVQARGDFAGDSSRAAEPMRAAGGHPWR